MRRSRPRRFRPVARNILAGVAALLAVTACGSSTKRGTPESPPSSVAPAADVLGKPNRATGTSVKVGLITDGDRCSGCSGAEGEEPVARATVPWLNEYQGGIAGHPITLDVCVDDLDPGKAADCANQMVRDNAAVVVIGSDGVIDTAWKILHDAHIPVVNNAVTNPALLEDTASTFVVNDPYAQIVKLPIAIAKDKGAKKVSMIVIDLPIATDIFKSAKREYEQNGLELDVVPVPLGTADMTPKTQQIMNDNPDGLVGIIGNDQFCIAALNGLRAVGFQGARFAISQCLTDATRKAVPGDMLQGMITSTLAPIGDANDSSMQQYQAVLAKYGKSNVAADDLIPLMTFQTLGALSAGTKDLTGDVTPASVITALKSMKNTELPGAGGRHFRCNGNAAPERRAVCSVSAAAATLDAKGKPEKYTVENDAPIGN